MPYQITSFQNQPQFGKEKPTIIITYDDPIWQQAYNNWLSGNNPTDSKEWKSGVFAETSLVT